jgi:hypothetical protein
MAIVTISSTGNGWCDARQAPEPSSESLVPGVEESWQVVYIGSARVGYGRSTTEHKQVDGRDVVVSDTEMSLAITRFGQAVKIKTVTQSEETPEGELLQFRFEMFNPPAAPTRKTGRVVDGKLLLETESAGKVTKSEIAWDNSIKAPGFQDRLLRKSPLKPGEKRTLKSFDPQYGKLNTIDLQAAALEEVELLGGEKKKLLKVQLVTSVAPGVVLNEFLDDQGEALKTTMSLMQMATYKVSREEALKSISGEEADLAVATLIKTTRIDRPQQTQRVVYRISTPGEDPSRIIATGPTQKVESVGPDSVDVTVKAIAPPAQPPTDTAPPSAEFLKPSTHIQSDDPQVRKLAAEAVGTVTDPWAAARLMERWVYQNLKKKNFSTLLASAAEVAKDLQGDCTEHAVLLAGMARARQIPSRIVVGLVYISGTSSFGGHMWTEVLIHGVWVPLDATLGQGGIGADHIKFADSSFADEGDASPLSTFLPLVSVLGKMKIEIRETRHK